MRHASVAFVVAALAGMATMDGRASLQVTAPSKLSTAPVTVAPILNNDQRARLQLGGALEQDRPEMPIHGLRTLVGEAKEHHARAVQDAECKQFSEVQVERQDNP